MKIKWEKLPKRINAFTVRSAVAADLDTGDIIQHYSSNTRITLTERCITPQGTYYRTDSMSKHGLNWAFEASAFGLPNELAPPVPSTTPNSLKPVSPRRTALQNKKISKKASAPKGGEEKKLKKKILNKLFGK